MREGLQPVVGGVGGGRRRRDDGENLEEGLGTGSRLTCAHRFGLGRPARRASHELFKPSHETYI
jgi:hypothetical protein